ncbi:MAG: hypothetical protein PHD51_01915 [Patescibacteria group bacterium]|nr:hypothetical protein [Patescibacteria group bacterium]MDD5490384.1 hypothetical protein [Patescibacteria group bacterium]
MAGGDKKFNRQSIRLKNYDYSESGYYFVTICVQGSKCLFGEVVNGEVILNSIGEMIKKWWLELENKFFRVELDKFIVMPNHFHGIINITIGIVGADLRVCSNLKKGEHVGSPLHNREHVGSPLHNREHVGSPLHNREHVGSPLHDIVKWFKTMTTNEYIKNVKQGGWPPFDRRLWQRNYWEHVIRTEKSLNNIREYILSNPENWSGEAEDFNVFVGKFIVKSAAL